jgi:hypothetical protein
VLNGHSHSYERSFLLDGHYGLSGTLMPGMKLDPGDGRLDGDGAYGKPPGRTPHTGEVIAVAGSSAQVSGGTLDHPAMAFSLNALGSLVLDVHGDSLEGRFLDDLGAVRDSFAIVRETTVIGVPAQAPRLALALEGANPSRSGASFSVELPRPGAARLSIVDAAGRLVRRLQLGEALSQRVVLERRGIVPGCTSRCWSSRASAASPASCSCREPLPAFLDPFLVSRLSHSEVGTIAERRS